MKLYNANAGNPKRVRIFIAEKGIDIQRVDLEAGTDTRTDEFRKVNSLQELPVLELDDGNIITESVAICRYLEARFPEPPLMGRDAFEQGAIEMWSQRIFHQLFLPHGHYVRHTIPLFKDVVRQIPEFAAAERAVIPQRWEWLNEEMSDGRLFIAGDNFSMADIHGMVVLMLGGFFDLHIPPACTFANRWSERVRARPSWDS